MLTQRWLLRLKEVRGQLPGGSLRDPAEMHALIKGLAMGVCNEVLASKARNVSDDTIRRDVNSRLDQNQYGLEQIIPMYRRVLSERRELADARKQEDWADFWEKMRFLAFRLALAIGIAAVVLAAGYVAREAGIPLPMLPRLPV